MAQTLRRCWPTSNPLQIAYHDREWGVPLHDDRALFEMLSLQVMQAGLSWTLVLGKRGALREAFEEFRPGRLAEYAASDVRRLLATPAIIRNRSKIEAVIQNARSLLSVQTEVGSFDRYVWQFVGGTPIRHAFRRISQLPAETEESRTLSQDLRRRGWRFVGPVVCYAFMQAAGFVNDHLVTCFRYRELSRLAGKSSPV